MVAIQFPGGALADDLRLEPYAGTVAVFDQGFNLSDEVLERGFVFRA